MAVETLSPDWEFDRVDDGSQSKSDKARAAGGRSCADLSPGGVPAKGLCVAVAAQPSGSGHFLRVERDALSSVSFWVRDLSDAGRVGPVRARHSGRGLSRGARGTPGGAACAFCSPGARAGRVQGGPAAQRGVWPCLWTLGVFAKSSERSILAEPVIWVPVSVSFFFFLPQPTFGSLTVFSFTFF